MGEDFFEVLGKKLKETAESVEKRGNDFLELQKMRSQKRDYEAQRMKNFRDIGEIIYARYRDGEAMDEDVAGICDEILELSTKIADMKDEIAKIKGQSVCPSCGAVVPKDSAFCMRCGAAFPDSEEVEEAEYAEAEENIDAAVVPEPEETNGENVQEKIQEAEKNA